MNAKRNIGLSIVLLIASLSFTSIYDIDFNDIDANSSSMSPFQGKRILIFTLPIDQNNSSDSLLRSLDSLAEVHSNTLSIIGVPSYEDGFTLANRQALKNWYRTFLRNSIIISEGMYTRKTSGSQQHELFRWLTDKNKNESMDQDVEGPGHKFFITSEGRLNGVFNIRVRLSSNAINRVLQQ